MSAFLHPADSGGRAYLAPAEVPLENDVPTPSVISVTVSPSTATGSVTFSAVVNGDNGPDQDVTWSRIPALGAIAANGAFTEPAQAADVQTITIIATSVQDPTKYGTATVTIAALPRQAAPSFTALKKGRTRRSRL